MSDDKTQEITNEGKPKYQPPQVLPLGGLTTGFGQCQTGSLESTTCMNGPSAGSTCNTGTGADNGCNTGGSVLF
jgi:hypothetical protein